MASPKSSLVNNNIKEVAMMSFNNKVIYVKVPLVLMISINDQHQDEHFVTRPRSVFLVPDESRTKTTAQSRRRETGVEAGILMTMIKMQLLIVEVLEMW